MMNRMDLFLLKGELVEELLIKAIDHILSGDMDEEMGNIFLERYNGICMMVVKILEFNRRISGENDTENNEDDVQISIDK